jgi:tetratricopeptide (TPR) repeat protein
MVIEGAEELQFASGSIPSGTAVLKPKSKVPLLEKLKINWRRRRGELTVLAGAPENTKSTSNLTPEQESLIHLICSPVQLQRAIQQLRNQSLVGYESSINASTLRIHDLIQAAIQERGMRNNGQCDWFRVAVELVCGAFRQVGNVASPTCWPQCETLCPHIQSLTKWDDEHSIGNSDLHGANIHIAWYFMHRGQYGEAEKLLEKMLAGQEKLLGPFHQKTLQTMDDLANAYSYQGRYNEALTLYGRALAGNETLLGSDHSTTLETVLRFANGYTLLGRYDEAETLYKRALAGNEKILGPDDPETLLTVNHLAVLYYWQGRYGEAETLQHRAMAGYEKNFGPDHPDTLDTVDSLASVYFAQGRNDRAETLYKRALTGTEAVLGPEHPETLFTVCNLAIMYDSQGRDGDAEVLYERALGCQEEVLAPSHPHTLRTVRWYAEYYKKQGRHQEELLLRNRFPRAFESQQFC